MLYEVITLERGRPVLGAIHQPITSELIIGAGGSTLLNGRPTRVRADRPLERATLMTTDPGLIETTQPPGTFERFETLRRRKLDRSPHHRDRNNFV